MKFDFDYDLLLDNFDLIEFLKKRLKIWKDYYLYLVTLDLKMGQGNDGS